MQVAVQAEHRDAGGHAVVGVGDGAPGSEVARREAPRHDRGAFEPVEVAAHVGRAREREPVGLGAPGADDVQPPDQHAETRGAPAVELGRSASALAVEEGVEDPPRGRRQRRAVGEGARRTDRNLLGIELGEEPVLFEDRSRRPALRAVELRHHARAVGELHLVDPVLERVQRIAERPHRHPRRLDRVEYAFRGEREKEIGLVAGLGHRPILSAGVRWRAERGR